MGRMVFKQSEFEKFILKVKSKCNFNWDNLGKLVGLTGRTLRDWKRGILYIYSLKGVKDYMRIFGSHNPRLTNKLETYLSLGSRLN